MLWLFLYLSVMRVFIFLFCIYTIFSCNKNENEYIDRTIPSRIFNNQLKAELPLLIKLYDKTFSKYGREGLHHFNFWMSDNYLYLHLTKMNCSHTYLEYYTFVEKVDNVNYRINLLEPFHRPERIFDLSNLKITPKNFAPVICDDFYYLSIRYKIDQEKIIREKIISSLEGLEWQEILADEDLDFFESYFIDEEPEPILEVEKSK